MVKFRAATVADIKHFRLRPEDQEEMTRFGDPDGLVTSFKLSKECWAIEDKGQIIAVAGYKPIDNGACLWILFADGLSYVPPSFFKESRKKVKYMLDKYRYLVNFAESNKRFVIKWAKSMGFVIDAPIEFKGQFYCKVHIGGE